MERSLVLDRARLLLAVVGDVLTTGDEMTGDSVGGGGDDGGSGWAAGMSSCSAPCRGGGPSSSSPGESSAKYSCPKP